jgi:hypothetical protein
MRKKLEEGVGCGAEGKHVQRKYSIVMKFNHLSNFVFLHIFPLNVLTTSILSVHFYTLKTISKMSSNPIHPSPLPAYTQTHRHRSSSLSIARSPAILASTAQSHDLPLNLSLNMTRTRSYPPHHSRTKSHLEDIPSDESDKEEEDELSLGDEDGLLEEFEEYELGDERIQGGKGFYEYHGPFQPPDSAELLGVLLSFGGVILLSLAAGLTTIYDWVL